MTTLFATIRARAAIAADKESPYTTHNDDAYHDGNNRHNSLLPTHYHSNIVIWYATHATIQAIAVLYNAEPTAHFQPSSEPIAIIVAKHGIYSNEKIRKAMAVAVDISPAIRRLTSFESTSSLIGSSSLG